MVFSDLFFLFVFIPLCILLYLIGNQIDNKRGGYTFRNFILIIFSLIFYAWGEPVYVFLMLFSVLVNYLFGLGIDSSQGKKRKLLLWGGVGSNLLILFFFKYAGLAARTIGLKDPEIALPIGISFYTFQALSYLVDVYRNDAPVQKKFSGLLLYISLFPQLVAGPIVRYNTIAEDIYGRKVTAQGIEEGIFRFLIGLGKKVILANQLSEVSSALLGGNHAELSVLGAAGGLIAFGLQIYYDFSGYSDMAIGIGRCLGFRFPENFNNPYCCSSVTDFWRRWHMTLGSFFRDYVYIPLGGNRRHQLLNILIVWLLTGFWHGAYWNYVVWGLWFGFFVAIEKFTVLKWKRFPSVLTRIFSLLIVFLGWGIFYFEDFSKMKSFFNALFFSKADFSLDSTVLLNNGWLLLVALIFSLPVGSLIAKVSAPKWCTLMLKIAVSVLILVVSVALLVGATNNAFIYTRF